MNTGIVSSRYAKAFLKFTVENGSSDRVCRQVQRILSDPDAVPAQLEPELQRLVEVLVQNGRIEDIKFVLRSFVAQYYESRNIMFARLVSVVPSEDLAVRMKGLLEEHFGKEVHIESAVDPDILGGFILEIGDYMLDASVRRQIDTIRRQFVINTNRIV